MIRPLAAPLLLLLLLAGGLVWRAERPDADLEYYSPEAFVVRSNRLIVQQGLLRADCSREPIRIEVDLGNVSEGDRVWYAKSYLKNDVERFNRDPQIYGWTFLIDEACVLRGVNPVVHAIQLPFLDRRRWLGNIYLRGSGADATLRSASRTLSLQKPFEVVSVDETASTLVGNAEKITKEVIGLHFGAGRTRPAATLHHVGRDVVVENLIRPSGPGSIQVLGHTLPEGRTARLETADWLNFAAGDSGRSETFVFTADEELDAISVVRQRNDRFERVTDDEPLGWIYDARGERPPMMLEGLVTSLHNALELLPEERGAALEQAFDLQLTVDRELQRNLDQALAGFSRKKQKQVGTTFSAGMTVLDGKSGELLALATYPHPEDLTADLDPRRRRRLLMNQNFVRHPIGSAGKPFFFAAIAERHPAFLDLVLDPHPEEEKRRELLQCQLKFGYQVLGSWQEVDFARAIEASSNRYTVELGFLALAAESTARTATFETLLKSDPRGREAWPRPGSPSGLRLGDQRLDFAPDFSFFSSQRDDLPNGAETSAVYFCEALGRLSQLAFRGPLSDLTGVATHRGEDPLISSDVSRSLFYGSYATQRYDLGLFRPLLEYLSAGEPDEVALPVRAALQSMAPERVNLAFNHVHDLRLDFVSMLLGGASSTWTNIQLAESLARMVTSRSVEARLIARVLPRDEETEATPEELPVTEPTTTEDRLLSPEVRREVLRGMENVVGGSFGTAPDLQDELQRLKDENPDRDIRLYSKTGSPTILIPVPRRTAEALTWLMREGRLAFDGQGLVVGRDQISYRSRDDDGRTAFVQALRDAMRDFAGNNPRVRRAVLGQFDEFQADVGAFTFAGDENVPDEVPSSLMVVGQQLRLNPGDPLFTQNLEREKGGVYIFSLVSLPEGVVPEDEIPGPERLADPQTRVISAALHVDLEPGSEVAVDTAEILLLVLSGWLEPERKP